MSEPLKLYCHKKTVRYYDYGDLLGTETGIAWSLDDNDNPMGFERGKTIEDVRARLLPFDEVELVEGRPVTRSFDMNPHGLI